MILAEHGLQIDDLDQQTISALTTAWHDRKVYEARLIALEVGKLLGGGSGEKSAPDTGKISSARDIFSVFPGG